MKVFPGMKAVAVAAGMLISSVAVGQGTYVPGQTFSAGGQQATPTPVPYNTQQRFYTPVPHQPQQNFYRATPQVPRQQVTTPRSNAPMYNMPQVQQTRPAQSVATPRPTTSASTTAPEKETVTKSEPVKKAEPTRAASTPKAESASVTPDSTDKLMFYSRKNGKKWIALTYDDGPNANLTPELMEYLKANNVPATFFVLGERVKSSPDLTKKLADYGFELANHTYSHPDLRKRSAEQVRSELQKTHDAVKEITGIDMKLMRPPYGAHNSKVDDVCRSMDYKIINWDVDTLDWKGRSADAITDTIMKGTGDGSIILMHDRLHRGRDAVLQATKNVVPRLRAQGYTFVTVGQLIELDGPAAAARPQVPQSIADLASREPAEVPISIEGPPVTTGTVTLPEPEVPVVTPAPVGDSAPAVSNPDTILP